jgi:CBS domain containing-hemolysin-like protein
MTLAQSLLLVPVLIAMNAFFVAAEYAIIAIRPGQIESLRKRGRHKVVAAIERLKANPASAIGTIQVCITMTNLLLGWIAEPAMTQVLQMAFAPLASLSPTAMSVISTALGFVIVTLLTVVLSELLPKALTLRFAEPAARFTARPVLLVQLAIRPLVWVMNGFANLVIRPFGIGSVEALETEKVSVDELRILANQAVETGVLTPRERSIMLASLSLGRRKAHDVMIHRSKVQFVDLNTPIDDNKKLVDTFLHNRFPLCDGDLDKTVGIIKVKEFLTAHHAGGTTAMLRLLADPPLFAPDQISLDQLLKLFRDNTAEMALLVNEYGAVEGLVTLQDVVDELLGDPAG